MSLLLGLISSWAKRPEPHVTYSGVRIPKSGGFGTAAVKLAPTLLRYLDNMRVP